MESYKNIFKVSSLFGGVEGLSILLNVIRTKLVAILLGPAGIGLNSIYNETRELIHSTTNLGLDVSGIRGISKSYEDWLKCTSDEERQQKEHLIDNEVSLLRSWVLILALIGTLVCMILAEPISYFTFNDYDHTWGYVLLSPVVGLSTMICGELAVLKALRRIKKIATVSIINVALTIVSSIPLYYYFGIKGVIPAFILLYITQFIAVTQFSYRVQRPTFSFQKQYLAKGIPMLMLGVSFALTGMINHGAQLSIRTYINNNGGLDTVGLFNAGYTIFMTVGSIAFASLHSYYFPQLSGVFNDLTERRQTVLRQTKVTLSIIIPVVLLLIAVLGWVLPLLFSHEFDSVVPMAQVAAVGLIFRAVYLPFAYIPLSAGDSKTYLLLEIISAAILVTSVITGYHYYGLVGAGYGMLISNAIDMCTSLLVAKFRYSI